MRVTVCQMPDDPSKFAREWERLATHVGRHSSDLVLLPEMPFYYWFCAGPKYDPEIWGDAVRGHGRWVRRLDELGAQFVLGSRPVDVATKRLNEGFAWGRKGGARGVHYKRYLPNEPGYYEARWYDRGERPFAAFEVGDWTAGFLICSDMWSMAHARSYGKSGAGLIAVPRATGAGSVDKWIAGGRVAAVVAGAYCASSNRSGKRGDATFGGRGWIIDPDGEVLALTSDARPFVTVSIDSSIAEKAKSTYPRDSFKSD